MTLVMCTVEDGVMASSSRGRKSRRRLLVSPRPACDIARAALGEGMERELLIELFRTAVAAAQPARAIAAALPERPKGKTLVIGAGKACLLYTSPSPRDS